MWGICPGRKALSCSLDSRSQSAVVKDCNDSGFRSWISDVDNCGMSDAMIPPKHLLQKIVQYARIYTLARAVKPTNGEGKPTSNQVSADLSDS
jgi:hypothetical protein